MKTHTVKFVLFLIFFNVITVFGNSAEINVTGQNKYKSIRLTPEIYNNVNSDLSDILIKNSDGENIPYFINSELHKKNEIEKVYPLKLINSYVKNDNFYFDYTLKEDSERDTIGTIIKFQTDNTNFAKTIEVYGSYDNINWEFIQEDKLYNVTDKIKLDIVLNKPQKYTYYRFKLSNNLEEISFNNVNLVYEFKTNETSYYREEIKPKFTREEKDKKTFINIEGLKNMRLADVTILPGSDRFVREVTAQGAGGSKRLFHNILSEISEIDGKDRLSSETTIALYGYVPNDNIYEIIIKNNDDKPIDIKEIKVGYYADEIIFEGTAGEKYTLSFGDLSVTTPPVYDIQSYKNEVLKQTIDRVELGPVSYVKNEIKVEKDYKPLFNIIVIIVALLLGTLILFKLKVKK